MKYFVLKVSCPAGRLVDWLIYGHFMEGGEGAFLLQVVSVKADKLVASFPPNRSNCLHENEACI